MPSIPLTRARKLLRARHRREFGLYLAEGPHVVGEALAEPGALRELFATHESMAHLNLSTGQTTTDLAINLRRAFSGIVAGNVREEGVRLVAEHGPFLLRGDPHIGAA